MKLTQILALGLSFFLTPHLVGQSVAKSGQVTVQAGLHTTEVTIHGEAAQLLYEALEKKENAKIKECPRSTVVTVAPFSCVRPKGSVGGVVCDTYLTENQAEFIAAELCEKPQPSIIGVGSLREAEDKNSNVTLDLKDIYNKTRRTRPLIPGTVTDLEPCVTK